ncbi:uncharacterized protein METZ01_LOCUS360852, partial [marine metagenome]
MSPKKVEPALGCSPGFKICYERISTWP